MCVCLYVCVCMHLYAHTHLYICVHILYAFYKWVYIEYTHILYMYAHIQNAKVLGCFNADSYF